jgi:hypothetical protein
MDLHASLRSCHYRLSCKQLRYAERALFKFDRTNTGLALFFLFGIP